MGSRTNLLEFVMYLTQIHCNSLRYYNDDIKHFPVVESVAFHLTYGSPLWKIS